MYYNRYDIVELRKTRRPGKIMSLFWNRYMRYLQFATLHDSLPLCDLPNL